MKREIALFGMVAVACASTATIGVLRAAKLASAIDSPWPMYQCKSTHEGVILNDLPVDADDSVAPASLGTPGPYSPAGLVATGTTTWAYPGDWPGFIIIADSNGVISRVNPYSEDIDVIYDLGAAVEATPAVLGATSATWYNDIVVGDNDGYINWIKWDGSDILRVQVGAAIQTPITLDLYRTTSPTTAPTRVFFGAGNSFYCFIVDLSQTQSVNRFKEDWHFDTGGTVSGCLAGSDGAVIFSSADGNVYSVWAKTENGHTKGTQRWSKNLDGPCMPTAGGGLVFVTGYTHTSNYEVALYGVNASDGSTAWSVNLESTSSLENVKKYAPSSISHSGALVYASYGDHVYVRNVYDGSEATTYSITSGCYVAAPPALDKDGNVFILDSCGTLWGHNGTTNFYCRDIGTISPTGMAVVPADHTNEEHSRIIIRNAEGRILSVGN